MNNEFQNFQPVKFQEHPVIDFTQTEPSAFDISSKDLEIPSSFVCKGYFLMEAYCQALIHRIQNLSKNEIGDFIDYQCSLVKNPLAWLDQLETLLELNYKCLETDCHQSRVQKLYVIIQFRRQELKPRRKPLKDNLVNMSEIASNEMVRFDFRTVKFDLNNLNSYEEKKAYLIELKADYLQSDPYLFMNTCKTLDKLIDIEMDKLEHLENIKQTSRVKGKSIKNANKIRIHGNLNVFVDVFYQMLYDVKPNGQSFLDCSPSEIADFIVNNFVDKEGCELSISTVRTILSPGKSDKRPSNDKRLKVKF